MGGKQVLGCDIYAIYTEDNERNGSVKELFLFFEEAMQNRMKYANWYCPNGDVWIYKYKAGSIFSPSEEWHIDQHGKIINHYTWGK